ncbi:MAG: NADH-quinone oxidoreductase subunit F, partial [Thermoanaerobaculia bacterium]
MEPVLLARVGKPGSRSIETYIGDGGYAALRTVLTGGWTPEKVTEEVKKSGLRGRGGAGFPAGVKWGFVPKDTKGKPVYLLCNADESEPGTFKDRLLIEEDPHQLIEGMILSAYAVKCRTAYIYIRGEFYLGARVLEEAVAEAYAKGYLG